MESSSLIKSLPQSRSVMLKLGPPKNKEELLRAVLETGLSCWADQILNHVQEMVLLRADPQWSWHHL